MITRQMARKRESLETIQNHGKAGSGDGGGCGGGGGGGGYLGEGNGGAGSHAVVELVKGKVSALKHSQSEARLDEENLMVYPNGAKCDGGGSCCHTFPRQHGQDQWHADTFDRKHSKTETNGKQRRHLSERGRNVAHAHKKSGLQLKDRSDKEHTYHHSTKEDKIFYYFDSTKGPKRNELQHHLSVDSKASCSVVISPMDVSDLPTPSSSNVSTSFNTSTATESGFSGFSSDVSTLRMTSYMAVPHGVVDIDEKLDTLLPASYSRDIMEYWQRMETKSVMPEGFLDGSPEVTPRMRGVLMDWLLQVQEHEEKQDETFHMCRVLIDRILAKGGVVVSKLQLVGITCLLIASKFCERFATEIQTLVYLTDNSYTDDQVKEYEKEVLTSLNWEITAPVCTHFLDRFLQVHSHSPEICHLSMYLVDLSVTSVNLACLLPSKLAAAALVLARRLLLPSNKQVWTKALRFYTGYSVTDLWEQVDELGTMLSKSVTAKLQGARTKYNKQERCFISFNPKIDITGHAC